MKTQQAMNNAVEQLIQRARVEVIDACAEHFQYLPEEVQRRMEIFIWLDDQSYPNPPEKDR